MEEKAYSASAHGLVSLDRFRAILESYGASPDRWPEAERDGALALIAESEEARKLRDAARRLDGVLRHLTPPAPSEALLDSLRRQPLPGAARREAEASGWKHHGWRLPLVWPIGRLVAFATVALVAFAIGLSVPSPLRPGDGTRTSVRPVEAVAAMDEADGVEVEALPIVDAWSDDEPGTSTVPVGITVAETTVSDPSPALDVADPAVEIPLY
ncbi:MAG: hypothetical protein ACE5KL_06105 [Alphaproteobacteria bacterium]